VPVLPADTTDVPTYPGVLAACEPLNGRQGSLLQPAVADVSVAQRQLGGQAALPEQSIKQVKLEHWQFQDQFDQAWNSVHSVMISSRDEVRKAEAITRSWQRKLSLELEGVADKSTELSLMMQKILDKIANLEARQASVGGVVNATQTLNTDPSSLGSKVLDVQAGQKLEQLEQRLNSMQDWQNARFNEILNQCMSNMNRTVEVENALQDLQTRKTVVARKTVEDHSGDPLADLPSTLKATRHSTAEASLTALQSIRPTAIPSIPSGPSGEGASATSIVASDVVGYLQLRGWSMCNHKSGQRSRIFHMLDRPVQDCLRIVEATALFLVLLNILFMGVSLDITLRHATDGKDPPRWLWSVDLTFALVFVTECLLRISILRCRFFQNWGNDFDTLIILFHVIDVASHGVVHDLNYLRYMQKARVFRVVRLLRFAQADARCRLGFRCITSTLMPMLWLMALTATTLYLCALILGQFATIYISNLDDGDHRCDFIKLYGSVHATMWTLFMAVTNGVSWQQVLQPFEQQSTNFRIIYGAFVSIFTFGIFNLATAIFCDAVICFATLRRDSKIIGLVRENDSPLRVIQRVLSDGGEDGFISRKKISRLLDEKEEVTKALEKLRMEVSELNGLAKLLDVYDNGVVAIDEFTMAIMQLKGSACPVATNMYNQKQQAVRIRKFSQKLEDSFSKLSAEVGGAAAKFI